MNPHTELQTSFSQTYFINKLQFKHCEIGNVTLVLLFNLTITQHLLSRIKHVQMIGQIQHVTFLPELLVPLCINFRLQCKNSHL